MKKNIIIIIAIGAIIIFIYRNRIKNLLGIETEAEVTARHAKEAAAVEAAARRAREVAAAEAVEAKRAKEVAEMEAAEARRVRDAAKAEAAEVRRAKEAAKAEVAARRAREAAKAEAAARRAREVAAAEAIEAKYARDAMTEAKHPKEVRLLRILSNLETARMSEYDRERAKKRIKKILEYRRGRVARGLNWYSDEEGRRRIGIPTPITPERAREADRERGRVGRAIPAALERARRLQELKERSRRRPIRRIYDDRRIGHIRPIPSEKIKVTGGRIVEPPSKEMMEERARRNRVAVEKQLSRAKKAAEVEAEAKRAIEAAKEELRNSMEMEDDVAMRAATRRLREAKKAKVEARRARQNAEALARSIGGWVRRPRPPR